MNQMINNESNVNYDMQQLMNITGQTAMNINNMSRQLGVVASAVDSIRTDVDGLTVRLQNLLETELAPIKFKRCMENINNDEVCMGNLMDIIHKLDSWSDKMKRLLNNDYIVDVQ